MTATSADLKEGRAANAMRRSPSIADFTVFKLYLVDTGLLRKLAKLPATAFGILFANRFRRRLPSGGIVKFLFSLGAGSP